LAYILDLHRNVIEQTPNGITLEKFLVENSFITKYLSRVVKDKALVIYSVLFHLSYFETGKGEITISWSKLGSYIRGDQGNIIDHPATVKRRIGDLIRNKCIIITRQRSGANRIFVNLPSDIPECLELVKLEQSLIENTQIDDNVDFYSDSVHRLQILFRDNYKCGYCLSELSENSFVLDHLLPISKGGVNYKNNLLSSCESCNQRKADRDTVDFLLENYRNKLLTQSEFLMLKENIEKIIANTCE
jgi:hypothetical protein